VVDQAVEAVNVGGYDGRIAWVLIDGGERRLGVADPTANGGNLVKDSAHQRVVSGVV
jgi:hypothetical protein